MTPPSTVRSVPELFTTTGYDHKTPIHTSFDHRFNRSGAVHGGIARNCSRAVCQRLCGMQVRIYNDWGRVCRPLFVVEDGAVKVTMGDIEPPRVRFPCQCHCDLVNDTLSSCRCAVKVVAVKHANRSARRLQAGRDAACGVAANVAVVALKPPTDRHTACRPASTAKASRRPNIF